MPRLRSFIFLVVLFVCFFSIFVTLVYGQTLSSQLKLLLSQYRQSLSNPVTSLTITQAIAVNSPSNTPTSAPASPTPTTSPGGGDQPIANANQLITQIDQMVQSALPSATAGWYIVSTGRGYAGKNYTAALSNASVNKAYVMVLTAKEFSSQWEQQPQYLQQILNYQSG